MTERTTHPGLIHRGRTAFVTGGGSGIGLETALTLADLGADVAVLDWTPGAAAAAAERIERIGRRALAIEGDTGDEPTVVDAFAATRRALGNIDVAVACAGVLGEGGPVFETSVEDFEHVMGVNVCGSFLVVREAARHMRPRRAGAIVLLSSLDGLQAEHGMFSYCTSKGALLNLARAAALDLARDGITVNCVCPSVTFTPAARRSSRDAPQRRRGAPLLRRTAPAGARSHLPGHRVGHSFRRLPARHRHHRCRHTGRCRHRRDLGQFQRPALDRRRMMARSWVRA